MNLPITINSKIALSLASISVAGALIVGATIAFFSDTETSANNLLQAGAIDLGIDNESFFNGDPNAGTSWNITYDLDDGQGPALRAYLFYDFNDIKPGDFGEDTISLHVKDNDCWLCTETTITADDDVDCTEPELDDETITGCDDPDPSPSPDPFDGELGDNLEIMWWADDGDNVFEEDERPRDVGFIGQGPQNTPVVRTIADSNTNIFSGNPDDPIPGCSNPEECTVYIAKAWCFGNLTPASLPPADYSGPDDPTNHDDGFGNLATPEDGGFTCDGSSVVGNAAQTDKIMMDIKFTAVQSRNNEDFVCPLRED